MIPAIPDPVAIRVVGCLIEKELSTPDNYPLSLNALTSACNQSSNRDPVMSLEENTVSQAIDSLRHQGLVRSIQAIGSRVSKYQHLIADVGEFSRAELAVVCVLTLRGAQTQAEVRTRASRLIPDDDATGLDAALEGLLTRDPQPLVARLARRPGQKEARYVHLLSGDTGEVENGSVALSASGTSGRMDALEEMVRELRNEIAELRTELAALRKQFE